METVAYIRVSSNTQDGTRQKTNLQAIAGEKGWVIKRFFSEKVSGTVKSDDRVEFKRLLSYVREKQVKILMVSEISRLGRRVVDVLMTIDQLHLLGVSLYVQQFNMCSLDDSGRENPMVKLLIQMLSMGAEMENNLRKERQMQGIEIAKLKGKYQGRISGSTPSPDKTLNKYKGVVGLLKKSNLSLREISSITKHSINTVRKVKFLSEQNHI